MIVRKQKSDSNRNTFSVSFANNVQIKSSPVAQVSVIPTGYRTIRITSSKSIKDEAFSIASENQNTFVISVPIGLTQDLVQERQKVYLFNCSLACSNYIQFYYFRHRLHEERRPN